MGQEAGAGSENRPEAASHRSFPGRPGQRALGDQPVRFGFKDPDGLETRSSALGVPSQAWKCFKGPGAGSGSWVTRERSLLLPASQQLPGPALRVGASECQPGAGPSLSTSDINQTHPDHDQWRQLGSAGLAGLGSGRGARGAVGSARVCEEARIGLSPQENKQVFSCAQSLAPRPSSRPAPKLCPISGYCPPAFLGSQATWNPTTSFQGSPTSTSSWIILCVSFQDRVPAREKRRNILVRGFQEHPLVFQSWMRPLEPTGPGVCLLQAAHLLASLMLLLSIYCNLAVF